MIDQYLYQIIINFLKKKNFEICRDYNGYARHFHSTELKILV